MAVKKIDGHNVPQGVLDAAQIAGRYAGDSVVVVGGVGQFNIKPAVKEKPDAIVSGALNTLGHFVGVLRRRGVDRPSVRVEGGSLHIVAGEPEQAPAEEPAEKPAKKPAKKAASKKAPAKK